MQLIDAHQHYWRVDRGDYAWLRDAPAPLQRDFLPADLQAQRSAAGVAGSVLVQAAASEAETRYLFELARADRSILGVVGWVDFEAPDAAARIRKLARDGDGLLLGLRPMAQDHPDPDWLARPALDAAFDCLQELDLAFDALVRPPQLPALQRRLQRERELRAVLDHGGKPDIAHGHFDGWAQPIRELAELPKLCCKFSGLLTELAPGMPASALDPYVEHLFASFGPGRLLWGSDWPVLTLRDSYAHWLQLARTLAQRHAPHALERIFSRNALAFYRPRRAPDFPASAGAPHEPLHHPRSTPMSARLQGKRALVTAAGAGIGRATALAFAREGAEVLATDIDAAALAGLAQEQPAIRTQVLDVTSDAAIRALVEANAPFDVLFNCAGYVHAGTILDTGDDAWQRSFRINVDGMYWLCRAVLPAMLERGRGSIINMSSVASSIKGVPNRFAYGTTKAAVIGLTRSIAADYVARGVRCNAICPGTVKTPSLAERVRALGGDEQAVWKSFTDRQPMGRLGTPEEIAALALYLASDESSFTTGTVHVVDGGWSN